jgi:succinate dehydrogenase / fumarate reductase membrane anchor subunit
MGMRMETPLARVRGLGSAGHGGGEWWAVRVNSVALLLLSVWLLVSLLRLPDLGFSTLGEWLRDPARRRADAAPRRHHFLAHPARAA